MADRIVKPDTGNDLVIQNDDASAKIEINEDGTIVITPGTSTSIVLGSDAGDDLNIGSGKLLVEGDTSLVSITGDIKVGGNNIEDSGGVVALTFDGSGNTNLSDKILQRPIIKDYAEAFNAIGAKSAAFNFDLEDGNVQTVTISSMTANVGITNSLGSNVNSLTVLMTNGGTATISWVAGAHGGGGNAVKWAGGSAPTLTASGVDVLTFITFDGGTNFYGFSGGLDFS